MMIRNAIGPYQLVRMLGQGAMGEVHLAIAHGASGFARQVAIKVVREHFTCDADVVKALIREASLGGRIHHRNVVGVLGLGVDEGIYYLVLEYLDGGDLEAHLARKVIPEPLALHVAHELALGLDHLHTLADDRGLPLDVIHRDVRPGNVLVSTTGDVKVADLGMAKVHARMVYTVSGTRKGTLEYMSPEQLAGERVTHATDQFALGMTLAEMLMRKRPYAEVSPLEMRELRRAGPTLDGIPDDIRAVLLRALAFEPADRFASMAALGDALADLRDTRARTGAADFAAWVRAN